MSPEERKKEIADRLESALHPSTLTIIDESQAHVGHAHGGAGHYALTIISDEFRGLSLVKRHQLVYQVLQDLIPGEIHALKINARTVEE